MSNGPIAPSGTHMQQTVRPTSSSVLPKFVLVCQNLEKYYGTRNNITKALDGINLSVQHGEFIAIMGPSGSGKTTLLNCISTIDQPTAGHIFIDDQEITSLHGPRDVSTRPAGLHLSRRQLAGYADGSREHCAVADYRPCGCQRDIGACREGCPAFRNFRGSGQVSS